MNTEPRMHHGVSFDFLENTTIGNEPTTVYLCTKLYTNFIVIRMSAILPSEAKIPTSEEFQEFAARMHTEYNLLDNLSQAVAEYELPVDFQLGVALPGLSIENVIELDYGV